MAINNDYTVGIKREVVNALKPVFGTDFGFPELVGKVYVGVDYPMEAIQYPAIFITYSGDTLENAGVSHVEEVYDSDSTVIPQLQKHWIFSGRINFNVIALNPLDRDRLAAALVNILAFSEIQTELQSFWTEIRDADYVAIQPLTDKIYPGAEGTGQVPWGSDDEMQFGITYSIAVFGEFWSILSTGELIQISEVDIYPYRLEEQDPPW